MTYQFVFIDDIKYAVEEKSLKRLFDNIVIVKRDEGTCRVHAPYMPVPPIVEKSLEELMILVDSSRYQEYIDLVIGHGAMTEDILNCFMDKR